MAAVVVAIPPMMVMMPATTVAVIMMPVGKRRGRNSEKSNRGKRGLSERLHSVTPVSIELEFCSRSAAVAPILCSVVLFVEMLTQESATNAAGYGSKGPATECVPGERPAGTAGDETGGPTAALAMLVVAAILSMIVSVMRGSRCRDRDWTKCYRD
jgi:hypothetical protein